MFPYQKIPKPSSNIADTSNPNYFAHNFYSILMKCCTEIMGLESKNKFARGQNPMAPTPMLPHFHPNALSMGSYKHHCNNVCGPTVMVTGLHDVSRGPLYAESCKMLQPYFAPKHTIGTNAFSVEICLAKCLTQNISIVMQDRGVVSKDHSV